MESLRNEPVYLGAGGTPGGYGSNLLETLLLAGVLGGNRGNVGYGYDPAVMNQIADARRDITKSEGDIKESFNAGLHRNQIETAAHFTALMNRSCDVEKEAIKSNYEGRLADLQTKSDLLANQNTNTISIKDDIKDFRFDVNSKFCSLGNEIDKKFHHVEHIIDKGFDKLVEREYKEEIRELRDKLDSFRFKETSQDLREIRKDVDKVLCGLGKIAPTNVTPTVLSGCC